MTRAQLKADYIREDEKRARREPTFRTNTQRLMAELKNLLPGDCIRFECFNDVEAEIIKDALTEDQKRRVWFAWKYNIP